MWFYTKNYVLCYGLLIYCMVINRCKIQDYSIKLLKNSKSGMEWMSFRVPYSIKYLEILDEICSEFIRHINLVKYAIKRESSILMISISIPYLDI